MKKRPPYAYRGVPVCIHVGIPKKSYMGTPRIHTLVDTIWELTCPDNHDYMAGEAEKTFASSAYHSKERNLTFEKCALLHLKQHQILEGLIPHGYNGIDPGLKVYHLNSWIKTNTLDAVKSRIISDEHFCVDFSQCITLIKILGSNV